VDWSTLSLAAGCLGFGAVVQSTVGFGMGVVAIPLLVHAGFSLPLAIGALLPNVLVQTAFSCWRHRRELPWADALSMSIWRYLSLPLGIWTLGVVAEQGQNLSRAVLGVGLLGVLATQQVQRLLPARRPGSKVTVAAGVGSGLLAGLIGMGGPPLVLWVMAQEWTASRQRCFLWLSFLLVMPLQFSVMAWRFGRPWAEATLYGLAVAPLILLIAWKFGTWADRWSKARLRQGMRLLLLLIAARLVWQWLAVVLR
jgi:uncharacterized protein